MEVLIDMGKKSISVVHEFKGKKASKKNPGSVKGTPDLISLASSSQDPINMIEAHHSHNAIQMRTLSVEDKSTFCSVPWTVEGAHKDLISAIASH